MPRTKGAAGVAGKTPAAELGKQIKKFGLSQAQVAKDVGLSVMTLKKILDGEAKVDIERALVFAKYFGTTADFWIELQKKAGLADAKKDAKLQKQLKDLKKAKPVKAEKPEKSGKTTKVAGKRGPKAAAKKGAKTAAAKKTPGRKPGRKAKSPSTPSSTPTTGSYSF